MQDETEVQENRTTGELAPVEAQADEAVQKPRAFKVKLTRKESKPDERVTLFTYPDGDGFGHFDASSGDEFEKEFEDFSRAKAFIDAALETGGFVIAKDSSIKPKA